MSQDPSVSLTKARNDALAAIDLDDWDGVIKACRKALLILSTIPDSRIGNTSDLEWDRAAIQKLLADAKKARYESGLDGCEIDVCGVEYEGVRGGSNNLGGCGC